MRRRPTRIIVLIAGVLGLWGSLLPAQQVRRGPQSLPLIRVGETPPLRFLHPLPPPLDHHVIPIRPTPGRPSQGQTDPVIQSSPTVSPSTPAVGLGFEGLGKGFPGYTVNALPPDPSLAVGEGQVVQWVNLSFAVFNTSGGLLYGPAAGNTPWQGSALTACAQTNDGDPIVQYNHLARRWAMFQLSYSFGPPYYICIAISKTADALGPWNLYALEYQLHLPDYPKIGSWPDGYYVTSNLFLLGAIFSGGQVCALDANILHNDLDPQPGSVQCFTLSNDPSLLPSDLDGPAPPPGQPNFVLNLGSNSLNLWRFHADFQNSNNTTLTGPFNVNGVAGFTAACDEACVPQPGTAQKLDALGDRLMQRLAYRNFGTHESLVVNHAVVAGSGTAVRWYEIQTPNSNPAVFQQGTYAPDSNHRWMGSSAMDKFGDIAVGYSVSNSSNVWPSIRFAGRVPGDPSGTLQTETSIVGGTGSQGSYSRWGDYTTLSVDPTDDCTFWYTNEYLTSNGSFNWNTRIASFKFPSCGGSTNTPPSSVSIDSPAEGASVSGTAVLIQISAADAEDAAGTLNVKWNVDGGAWQTAAYNNVTGKYEANWNTTTVGNGGHTINAQATDSGALTTTDSNNVTVNNPTPTTMHVGDLDGSKSKQGAAKWKATVTITIHDSNHNPVANAAVSGAWSAGASGSSSCTTGANGQCSVTKSNITNSTPSVTFSVTGVTHATLTYSASANHDPDGDSTGTSITVTKP